MPSRHIPPNLEELVQLHEDLGHSDFSCNCADCREQRVRYAPDNYREQIERYRTGETDIQVTSDECREAQQLLEIERDRALNHYAYEMFERFNPDTGRYFFLNGATDVNCDCLRCLQATGQDELFEQRQTELRIADETINRYNREESVRIRIEREQAVVLREAQDRQNGQFVCSRCNVWSRSTVRTYSAYVDEVDTQVIQACYDCNGRYWWRCECGYSIPRTMQECPEGPHYDDSDEPDEPDSSINAYSYRPRPVFYGDGPVFLGWELEVECDQNARYGRRCRQSVANTIIGHTGNVVYLKNDGSLSNGIEIVTHPMSYEYAKSEFPWPMLSDLRALEVNTHVGTGLHVHVSRKAFANSTHVYRWMKFLYRNARGCQKIARRESGQWASFSQIARDEVKDTCKGYPSSTGRYVAINTENRATFEVRIFQASLDSTEILAALGLVDASVEYTRTLTASDILHNDGWKWSSFRNWLIANNSDKYAELIAEMDKPCAS